MSLLGEMLSCRLVYFPLVDISMMVGKVVTSLPLCLSYTYTNSECGNFLKVRWYTTFFVRHVIGAEICQDWPVLSQVCSFTLFWLLMHISQMRSQRLKPFTSRPDLFPFETHALTKRSRKFWDLLYATILGSLKHLCILISSLIMTLWCL